MLGYIVGEKVFVLLNAGQESNSFENISLPEGSWKLIATTQAINVNKGVRASRSMRRLTGGKEMDFEMEGTSLMIWVRE